jgi:hypothetical protein
MATVNELFAPKAGDRYIVLGEKEQELPQRFRVSEFKVKESGSGKQYVELKCLDDAGVKLMIAVFQRDVKKCVEQWGTDPTNWQWIQFTLNMTANRYFLEPAKNQLPESEDV